MSVEQEILVTGIKVVDLLAPYAKGGKIGKPEQEDLWSIGLGRVVFSSCEMFITIR